MEKKLSVLILSKDLRFEGGVVNFISMLIQNLSDSIDVESFPIGQPYGHTGIISKAVTPVVDNLRLLSRVRQKCPDCVHINPSLNRNAFVRDALQLVTLKAMGFKSVLVFFHGWEEEFLSRIRDNVFYRLLLRRVYGDAPRIVVLADRFKSQLESMGIGGERIVTVTTMFDGSTFVGVHRKSKAGKCTLLFLSRFARDKGVFELIEAFRRVRERISGVRLVLAGDGPERREMELLVNTYGLAESVCFAGYLRGREKAQALADADVFVFPSYHGEGCPVSLLEAMAAGLPIISTDVGGISDIFINGQNGILLREVSPDELIAAIFRMLQDDELRRSAGQLNREIAWKRYEGAIVSRRIEQLYEQVVSLGYSGNEHK